MRKTLKNILSTILCVITVSFILGAWGIYSSESIWFDAFDKLDETLWPYQKVMGTIRHSVEKAIDGVSPRNSEKAICSILDVYDLELSPADVRRLLISPEENQVTDGRGNTFRKVKVHYHGNTYQAKMRLHGDETVHLMGKKRSFQLKFSKEKFLNGNQRLIFIIPEDRHYFVALFGSRLAKFLGLSYVENDLVAVRINSVFQGVYYVEEYLNEKFLERRGIPNSVIIQLTDNWIEDRRGAHGDTAQYYGGITYNDHHTTPFDLEIGNLKAIDSVHEKIVYKKTEDLFRAIKESDMVLFESLLDHDRMGATEAWRTLLGDRHTFMGDNVRLVYSFTNGKFFLIPRSEGDSRVLEYERGSFDAPLNKKADRIVPFLEMLARSPKIRAVRNQWLHQIINQRDQFLELYDQLTKNRLKALRWDRRLPLSSRAVAYDVKQKREILANNFDRLKQQFEYAKAYVNGAMTKNMLDLEILPDTSFQELELNLLKVSFKGDEKAAQDLPPKLEKISILEFDEAAGEYKLMSSSNWERNADLSSLFKGKAFGFQLDPQLHPDIRRYRYRIIFHERERISVEQLAISFRTALAKQTLSNDDIYVKISDRNDDLSDLRFQSAERFIKRYPQLNWDLEHQTLTLKPGIYAIDKHVLVPENLRLRFSGGVELLMGPGVVFLSYSPIEILGSEEAPVQVRAADPTRPFGAFAVVGDETDLVKIQFLDLSGGSEAFVNGMFFSGALSLYHTDVELDHVNIHHNFADDGLNIKYGKVHINHSRFADNFADQIDLDFCRGVIENSEFTSAQQAPDQGGDGLDLSGSEVMVRNSKFHHFSDKGISVGESSKVVLYRNEISENHIGLAVKDSSQILLNSNRLTGNQVGLSAYQKKQIFTGGRVYELENNWQENGVKIELANNSIQFAPNVVGKLYFTSMDWTGDGVKFDELFGTDKWRPM